MVKESNIETNKACKGRDKQVDSFSVNVNRHKVQVTPSLLLFIQNGATQNIVYLYFSTYFVTQNLMETKDISAKEKKNPK